MKTIDCAVVGSGAAALMAADQLSAKGLSVAIFERKSAPGWKLLVAGSSGLNITYDAPLKDFIAHYTAREKELAACIKKFPPSDWVKYVKDLGEDPYVGSSHRYFIRNKTAATLLNSWTTRIKNQKAIFYYEYELSDFEKISDGFSLSFTNKIKINAKYILFALGGASWETVTPSWHELFRKKGLELSDFAPANAGYHLQASEAFFQDAEGKPIKGLILKTAKGEKQGELMITKYGLEGTPIYTMGTTGPAFLDLKPDVTEEKLVARLNGAKGDIHKKIEIATKLSDGAKMLIKHLAPTDFYERIDKTAAYLKNFPIILLQSRSLSESISSSGGLSWNELNENLELKKIPGIYCAGEMIDWDAPTGGFLIQACVSMGHLASTSLFSKI